MWKSVLKHKPVPPCLAWDSKNKTVGLWDGGSFDSFTGGYSFDGEYSKGMTFYCEGSDEVCGRITHWMPLPKKPPKR